MRRLSETVSGIIYDRRDYDSAHARLANVFMLDFWLTNRCNLNCYFCPIVRHSADPRTQLDKRFIEDFLSKASKIFPKLNLVRFSGGEPLLHPQFEQILENVISCGYKVVLFTNGVLMKGLEEVGLLEKCHRINVSLHSIRHYEEVFGISNKKIKEQVLASLRSLKPHVKEKTSLAVGLTKYNMDLKDVIEFGRSFGFKITVFPIHNLSHAQNLTYDIEEEGINPKILEIMKQNTDVIHTPCSHIMQKWMELKTNKQFTWTRRCISPLIGFIVDYAENLRLCPGDQPPIGKAVEFPRVITNQISRQTMHEAKCRLGACRACLCGVDPCFKHQSLRHLAAFTLGAHVRLRVP